MMRHTQKRPVARGVRKANGMVAIVVHFPEDTFQEIRERALAEGTSWSEQARTLVEWGLESERVEVTRSTDAE